MERKAIADKWIPIGEKEDVIFCEMSSRRKSKTGLPMNIWIDDSKSYIAGKHSKRIKFQLDKGQMNPDNFGTMDLDGVIHKPDHPIKQLHQSDLTQLRNFVRNNKYALERLADIEIDIEDIWPSIIRGGEPATEGEIDALNGKVDELAVIDDD